MLLPVASFLLLVLLLNWRKKGPVWALALSWLVCLLPIFLNLVSFRYLTDKDGLFSLILIGYLGSFVLGAWLYSLSRDLTMLHGHGRIMPVSPELLLAESRRVWPVAILCWWVAFGSTILNYVDFLLLGGEGLNDLAALRDTIVNRSSASIYGQIASLGTWASMFCFIYGLLFRPQLHRWKFLLMMLPIFGFFSLSVLSAGRQTALQIMLLLLLVTLVSRNLQAGRNIGRRIRRKISRGEKFAIGLVSGLMISYMGFIAVARNDGSISDDKSVMLMQLFEFRFQPWVEQFFANMGTGLRGAFVEGVIYFSSPVGLFENFLNQRWTMHWGETTFPFMARQLQRFTGAPITPAFLDKVDTLNESGVIGVGWTTSISSYILDYGYIGAILFMFVLGYYSQLAWIRLVSFRNFYDVVIGILVILNAIYMPLIPSYTETNIFLLWTVAILLSVAAGRRRHPAVATRGASGRAGMVAGPPA